MAGATNRHLKAMGFREAGIQQIRTTGGRGLSLESAISSARAHGVALPGPALQRVGASASEGWKAASRGEKTKRPEKPGESLDAYRARDLASRDPATMRAAIREQIKRVRDVGHNADVNKLSDMLRARDAAAKGRAAERGGQQDLFGANPAPRGPSPFEVRAKAAAERRAAMVASAQQRTGRLPQALGGAARGMLAQRKAAAKPAPDPHAETRARIAKLEAQQDLGKRINKVVLGEKRKGGDDWQARASARLLAEKIVTRPDLAANVVKPDFAGRHGIPDYQFTNTGATIRRLKDQIGMARKKGKTMAERRFHEDPEFWGPILAREKRARAGG